MKDTVDENYRTLILAIQQGLYPRSDITALSRVVGMAPGNCSNLSFNLHHLPKRQDVKSAQYLVRDLHCLQYTQNTGDSCQLT